MAVAACRRGMRCEGGGGWELRARGSTGGTRGAGRGLAGAAGERGGGARARLPLGRAPLGRRRRGRQRAATLPHRGDVCGRTGPWNFVSLRQRTGQTKAGGPLLLSRRPLLLSLRPPHAAPAAPTSRGQRGRAAAGARPRCAHPARRERIRSANGAEVKVRRRQRPEESLKGADIGLARANREVEDERGERCHQSPHHRRLSRERASHQRGDQPAGSPSEAAV